MCLNFARLKVAHSDNCLDCRLTCLNWCPFKALLYKSRAPPGSVLVKFWISVGAEDLRVQARDRSLCSTK